MLKYRLMAIAVVLLGALFADHLLPFLVPKVSLR